MIEVTVRPGPGECRVTLEGHATGDERVCAGVSALVCTMAEHLKDKGSENFFMKLEGGAAEIMVKNRPGEKSEAADCLQFVLSGIRRMAQEYPDLIQIRDVEPSVFYLEPGKA